MPTNILNYRQWGSRIFEQAEATEDLIINLTITSGFRDIKPFVPTRLETPSSEYIWASAIGEKGQPIHTGEGQYIAFKTGEAIMIKHDKGVTIFGKDAGKLTAKQGKESQTWTSAPTGGIAYMTVMHSPGGPDSGIGPGIRYADTPNSKRGRLAKANGQLLGAFMVQDMLGGDKSFMSKMKATDDNVKKVVPVVMKALAIANQSGIIDEVPGAKNVLMQAGVGNYSSYQES